jgi:ubiquinone/menaquinone biosynthesis C-methylase UbiE
MTLSKRIAAQLGNPTGLVGNFVGFVWNRRNAALNDRVLELLVLQRADRVLDIGFGGGYLLNRMSATVTDGLLAGVDISPAMVAYGEKRYARAVRAGRLSLKCGAVEALPYPANHFTKVCSVNSLFYWQNIDQGLDEIKRVLEVEGKVVLCFTLEASLEKRGFAKHIRLYTAEEIAQLVTAGGFKDAQTAVFSDKYRQYACVTGRKGL